MTASLTCVWEIPPVLSWGDTLGLSGVHLSCPGGTWSWLGCPLLPWQDLEQVTGLGGTPPPQKRTWDQRLGNPPLLTDIYLRKQYLPIILCMWVIIITICICRYVIISVRSVCVCVWVSICLSVCLSVCLSFQVITFEPP